MCGTPGGGWCVRAGGRGGFVAGVARLRAAAEDRVTNLESLVHARQNQLGRVKRKIDEWQKTLELLVSSVWKK